MKMDIACPVELIRFEEADFGEGRRQAYLTFLNESMYVVTALSGQMILLNEDQEALDERRVSFGPIAVEPGETFLCHLALDGYPPFTDAAVLVEDVLFDGEEPWALHPSRVKDYVPPVLEEGPARNALIAVAGHDAVCYPEKLDNLWVCVCGRYNRARWPVCRRCRRERDEVLAAYTPERVGAAFSQRVREDRNKPPRVLVQGTPPRRQPRPAEVEEAPPRQAKPPKAKVKRTTGKGKPAQRAKPIKQPKTPKPKKPPRLPREPGTPVISSRMAVVIASVLVGALLLWLVLSIASRFSGAVDPSIQGVQGAQPGADYLDVLR